MALQPTAMPSTESEVTALDPKDNPDDKIKEGQDMASGPGTTSMPSSTDEATALDPKDNPDDVMSDAQSMSGGTPSQTPTPTPGKGSAKEEDSNLKHRSPLEQWVEEIMKKSASKPSDSETSTASPMKAEKGQYDKVAEQNNSPAAGSDSPALAEEATEVVAENPELLAGM